MREGDLGEAARIILENDPMPALTGVVCPHYCESQCNRGKFDEAVSIRCVESVTWESMSSNMLLSLIDYQLRPAIKPWESWGAVRRGLRRLTISAKQATR